MEGHDESMNADNQGAPSEAASGAREELDRLLQILCDLGGSDLHIKGGALHSVRVDGHLGVLGEEPPISAEDTLALAEAIMPPNIRTIFWEKHEADFAYSLNNVGRFRINAFYQRGSVALAIRQVSTSSSTIEELGLPDVVRRLAEEQRGLVVVTGPTGSGKTTTLAAMINHINETRACHIVTVEDPIECIHRDKIARIDQREVGFDTETFSSAMRVVLRQDPDVILVGEMRDSETVFTALTAAETGHLVFSTLHTTTAPETINRIIDFFPPHQHHQIRLSLAGALKGTIGQRLVPRADGIGRVPALEVMIVNGRIQQSIADPLLTSDISTIIADGEYYGMQTFDQGLRQLVVDGSLDYYEAINAASNPHDLKVMLGQLGIAPPSGTFVPAFTP
jgi:twitching motility protein PilT